MQANLARDKLNCSVHTYSLVARRDYVLVVLSILNPNHGSLVTTLKINDIIGCAWWLMEPEDG